MKTLIILLNGLLLAGFTTDEYAPAKTELIGAWEKESEGDRTTWIFSEKYFASTTYNAQEKKFIGTYGGSWRVEGNKLIEMHEFNTFNPDQIGRENSIAFEIKKGKLILKNKNSKQELTQIDNGTPGALAGAWLITGRMNDNGDLQKITPGVRRTMKILSGTRFQWIAYNIQTKEFSGTGGGTYTTQGGKYTENIEFFSRDNSRAGMSLQFDYALEDGNWRHKGSSSKGDPIDEVWTKRERIGI